MNLRQALATQSTIQSPNNYILYVKRYSIDPKFKLSIISEYISRPSGYDCMCAGIYVMHASM